MKKQREAALPRKEKTAYRILFAIAFSVPILSIFFFREIYQFVFSGKDWLYVSPAFYSAIIFWLLQGLLVILLLFLYSRSYSQKIPLADFLARAKRNKSKIILLCFVIVLLLCISFSSPAYIDESGYHEAGREPLSFAEIERIDLFITKDSFFSPNGAILSQYGIECKLVREDETISLYSADFYGYPSLLRFFAGSRPTCCQRCRKS